MPPGTCRWREGLANGTPLRMGESIGALVLND
jgi:hypothetical protein